MMISQIIKNKRPSWNLIEAKNEDVAATKEQIAALDEYYAAKLKEGEISIDGTTTTTTTTTTTPTTTKIPIIIIVKQPPPSTQPQFLANQLFLCTSLIIYAFKNLKY